jgi:hypothetical protein
VNNTLNQTTNSKIERFLRGKVVLEVMTCRARPAWKIAGLGCFWLNEKNKIESVDFRRLIEMGYFLKSEKGLPRAWVATEKPRKKEEEEEEEEAAQTRFWIKGGRVNNYHGPTKATMLLGSIK